MHVTPISKLVFAAADIKSDSSLTLHMQHYLESGRARPDCIKICRTLLIVKGGMYARTNVSDINKLNSVSIYHLV